MDGSFDEEAFLSEAGIGSGDGFADGGGAGGAGAGPGAPDDVIDAEFSSDK